MMNKNAMRKKRIDEAQETLEAMAAEFDGYDGITVKYEPFKHQPFDITWYLPEFKMVEQSNDGETLHDAYTNARHRQAGK